MRIEGFWNPGLMLRRGTGAPVAFRKVRPIISYSIPVSYYDKYGFSDQETDSQSIEVGCFDLADYQLEMSACSYDKQFGHIDNAESAIKYAKALWIEWPGQFYPQTTTRIEVEYDEDNDCWHIKGTLPNTIDIKDSEAAIEVPHALILGDGTVLAVWQE
ncbi:MAG: hypothetical protein FWD45_00710 [Coriobacteriia bacterium]|nr:hypothetical protein [Coriobacteriia bacterium]